MLVRVQVAEISPSFISVGSVPGIPLSRIRRDLNISRDKKNVIRRRRDLCYITSLSVIA